MRPPLLIKFLKKGKKRKTQAHIAHLGPTSPSRAPPSDLALPGARKEKGPRLAAAAPHGREKGRRALHGKEREREALHERDGDTAWKREEGVDRAGEGES